ncbi:MAG: hypothetical protein AB1384_00235 [Actinomycetota bacterium]
MTVKHRPMPCRTLLPFHGAQRQVRWWIRVLYYPFGLVFSLIAIFLGWFLCVFLITLPLGIVVFNKVPAIASLHRG